MRAVLATAVFAIVLGGPAAAQEPSAPVEAQAAEPAPPGTPDPDTLDDVVVVGGELEALAREFVASLSAPGHRRGLARWDGEVCLGILNFRSQAAYLISDRISDVARELEIRLGEPGCEPNLLIFGTTDGPGMARAMASRYRSSVFRYGFSSSNRGNTALEIFQTSDAPVRWWHISLPVVTRTGQPAIRLPGKEPVPARCRTRNGFWMANCDEVTDRIIRMIAIVDIDEFENVSFDQLADYLTLIALAQIEPEADHAAFDTVLNLFNPAAAVSGLTDWDMIYLRAL